MDTKQEQQHSTRTHPIRICKEQFNIVVLIGRVIVVFRMGHVGLGIIKYNLTNNDTVESDIVVANKQINFYNVIILIIWKEMCNKSPIAAMKFNFLPPTVSIQKIGHILQVDETGRTCKL